jgi:hypothetical protein
MAEEAEGWRMDDPPENVQVLVAWGAKSVGAKKRVRCPCGSDDALLVDSNEDLRICRECLRKGEAKMDREKSLEEAIVEAKREEAEKKAVYLENFRGGLLLDHRPRKPGKKALGITREINIWQRTADGWYTNKAIADISPPFPDEEYKVSGYKGDFLTKALRDGSWKGLPPPVWVKWGQWNLAVFANEEQVVLDAKYYSYFQRKYPGCLFMRSEKYEYTAVRSLDLSVVGVIMSITWEGSFRVKFDDNAGSPWVDVQTFWSEIRRKAEEGVKS